VSHVTARYKLVDPWCINPLTGELLFGDSGSSKVQSHIHCFPIKIVMAKDTKQRYHTEFSDLFLFLREYEREHGFRVKFSFPQDMSSFCKTTGRGGTAKVKTFHATAAVLQWLHLLLHNRKINAFVVPGAYNLNATITTC
jgi:hypothetical protein